MQRNSTAETAVKSILRSRRSWMSAGGKNKGLKEILSLIHIYADVMTAAFQEFSAKKLNREKKPSIRKALCLLYTS